MIKIDYENLFVQKLHSGINIFAGAGFSKLESPSGKNLPDAAELCTEICDKFQIPASVGLDLEKISTIVNLRAKQQFQTYLREKYTVSDYNSMYDALTSITINSFITTNIDNIIQCVMDNSQRYSLHDIETYGAHKKSNYIIPFIPLHGNVKDLNSNLYFGKSEIANVDNDNRALFSAMHSRLLEAPTLFWGYGFHDSAIERTIAKILENRPQEIWIQCLPSNENIEYFRQLGCYIIEGTTFELLQWIQEKITVDNGDDDGRDIDRRNLSSISQYFVPSKNQIETVTHQDYYANGVTHWYCILSNYAYETKAVNRLHENLLGSKNVIAVGIPFSGKTTIMMQLAAKIISNITLVVQDITIEEAKRITNVIGNRRATILVDNCCNDAYVIRLFMEQSNISVIGFTNDYEFESTKHLFDGIGYSRLNIDELDIDDAQRVFQKIPETIRVSEFKYKQDNSEKYSMLELLGHNVSDVISRVKVKNIIKKVLSTSEECFQVIALTTYLTQNKSALTTDVLCSYFNTTNYDDIRTLINATQGYLSDLNVQLTSDAVDQDYYCMRSHLFAYYAFDVLMESFKSKYCKVIRTLIQNVSPYNIFNYYIFKRSAYDARFFQKLFSNTAHDLYDHITKFDVSAYSLQQWALYKAYLGDYSGAFSDIEQAMNMSPGNFSIRNSHAIILFESNKDKKSHLAQEGIAKAMETLNQCFTSDKRKVYHAQKYAEFSIYLSKHLNNYGYLDQAYKWLTQIINTGESSSIRTKKLLSEVQSQLNKTH